MGLLGCPASFQRLMEAVVWGIDNILVYIDDLLVHSDSHKKQLELLDQLFDRLVQHSIKVNLDKLATKTSVIWVSDSLTK